MQLDVLWKYQQVDIEVERFENEIRNDPDRLKLLKHRTEWMEQQEAMKKVESDVAVMADRLEAIEDEARRLTKQLSEQKAKFVDEPSDDLETVQEGLKQMRRTLDLLTRYEQELNRLRHDAAARDRQQRDIRLHAARIKAEYDSLKTAYDVKFRPQKQKLDQMKANAEKASAGIDPALMQRYRDIRRHCFPPIALLNGDRCAGCNMSLPSAVMREINDGKLVECDNCGRILFLQQD